MKNFFRSIGNLISSMWMTIVHLFQPTPGTKGGVATSGDLTNSGIASGLLCFLTWIAGHAAQSCGFLTGIGFNPDVAASLVGWITFMVQALKKLQDYHEVGPAAGPVNPFADGSEVLAKYVDPERVAK